MTEKKTLSRIGFALSLMVISSNLASLLAQWAMMSFYNGEIPENAFLKWFFLFGPLYLIGMPLGILAMGKRPGRDVETTQLTMKELMLYFLMCLPVMYGGSLIGNLLSSILSGGTAQNQVAELSMDTSIWKIIVMVILAPILEEYLMRKQLIDRCGRQDEKLAIFFSALTFGMMHMNLFQFFYAFGVGWLLAYVYSKTRLLRYSVILHMIINFMGAVLAPWMLKLVDLDMIDSLLQGTMQIEQLLRRLPGFLVYLLYSNLYMLGTLGGLIVLITHWKKFTFKPAAVVLSNKEKAQLIFLQPGMILFSILFVLGCVLSLFA